MKLYTFTITLIDTGLPYPSKAEAIKDANESANEIATAEGYTVAKVEVTEDE